eukprot:Partr_v1_DN26920_c0_g3_i2_m7128 putative 3-hydroxyisobutyryl-CoA hydrolase
MVALMNGIVMGGGVGVSVHAPFRVATENTLFAMPETAIGLFPDVGGSFFLPRLDGQLGRYLALTGARLKGEEAFWAGIATHYVPADRMAALESRLQAMETENFQEISLAIEEFSGDVSYSRFSLGADSVKRDVINTCFAKDTVEDIMASLEAHGSDFALKTLETLRKMSPTSLKVTLKQLKRGKDLDILKCFMMEYRMATRALAALTTEGKCADFKEGVDALLISKTNAPKWKPESLADVTDDDVDWYFRPFDSHEEELALLNSRTYDDYPYNMGLPSEQEIIETYERIASKGAVSKARILERFSKRAAMAGGGLKIGLTDKVQAVIDQRFSTDTSGNLQLSTSSL